MQTSYISSIQLQLTEIVFKLVFVRSRELLLQNLELFLFLMHGEGFNANN